MLVDDVVAAFAAMGRVADMPREIIDIGSGEPATILDVAVRLLGLLRAPTDRYRITGAYRPGDIRYAVADITRARETLGWSPETTLQQGLEALVRWSQDMMKTT